MCPNMSRESEGRQLENSSLFESKFLLLIAKLFHKRSGIFVFVLLLFIYFLSILSASNHIHKSTKRIITVSNVSQASRVASINATSTLSLNEIHHVVELSNALELDVGLASDCLDFAKRMVKMGILVVDQLKELSEARAIEVLQGSGMNELQIRAVMNFIAISQTPAPDPNIPAILLAPATQSTLPADVPQSMVLSAPLQQESLSHRSDGPSANEQRLIRDFIFNGLKQYPTVPRDPYDFFYAIRDLLVICNPNWRGIRAASLNQGEPVVEVQGVSSASESEDLVKFIASTKVKRIVINGVPNNMIHFARHLKQQIPDMGIYFIFHGTLVQHILEPDEAILVDQLIQSCKEGSIKKIGFVKSGVAEFISTLGVKALSISNFQPSAPPLFGLKLRELDSHAHIGVFGDGGWIKNTVVQLAAACMLENIVIHVIRLPSSPYFQRCRAQVVVHGLMSQRRFLNFMSQVDLTMYVSLSESFPMTVMESLSVGVPCLTSNTHGLFNNDPFLKKYLVVPEHDNPDLIRKAILRVLEHRHELIPRFESFLECLNLKARSQFDFFVDRTPQLLVPPCPLDKSAVGPSTATPFKKVVLPPFKVFPFFLPILFYRSLFS
jgi:glycosyltransferase involved in cell wall biosynthesis